MSSSKVAQGLRHTAFGMTNDESRLIEFCYFLSLLSPANQSTNSVSENSIESYYSIRNPWPRPGTQVTALYAINICTLLVALVSLLSRARAGQNPKDPQP